MKSFFELSQELNEAKKINVYRVTSNKMQGNVHAKDEKEARKVVKEKKEYKKFKMHIDGIQEITTVDNYKVELTKI